METKANVIKVLTIGPSQQISFKFTGASGTPVTVNPSAFKSVATAIQGGKVDVMFRTDLAAGIAAQYLSAGTTFDLRDGPAGFVVLKNTVLVQRLQDRVDEATLLHESLHCFFDLTFASLTAAEEEAAAYITDFVYFLRTGVPVARRAMQAFADQAQPIADAVIANKPITAAMLAKLVDAIAAHPQYNGKVYVHDG